MTAGAFSISFSLLSQPGSSGSTGRLGQLPVFTSPGDAIKESRLCLYLQEVNPHSVQRVGTFLSPKLKTTSEELPQCLLSSMHRHLMTTSMDFQMWEREVNLPLWLVPSSSQENRAGDEIFGRGSRRFIFH